MLSKLRQLRLQKGISQTYISKRLGFKHPSGYANIEMGRNRLSFEDAVIVADILGVEVSELQEDKVFFEQKLHVESKTSA
ncbi:helix-turn-helix domain-containing protein [Cohnella nanjingensis]|uniref:Helix-turn-helix transcriptional regulator n=1 Tax=Cohnella nanjingensis TaxID=1387779 RepID=A0A7X0RRZ6_9BACL|nr:helix-turn-helix transcriptional regulator [Cohnella nanjingensis]MBB6672588.1 helix-turn-helix transcriptional regulator [Cohnella nanjingensis]